MKHFLLFCTLLVAGPLLAQVQTNSSGTYTTITIYDPFQVAYAGIGGSPYIPEKSFADGIVVVNGVRRKLAIRYNTQEGKLDYLDGAKALRMTTPVSEFQLPGAVGGDTLLFRKGFAGKGDLVPGMYCQVLFEGKKSTLIRSITTTVRINNDSMSNDFGKSRFEQRDQYYLLVNNELTSLTPSKTALIAAFPAPQRESVLTLIGQQTGKIKSWTDVKQILALLEK